MHAEENRERTQDMKGSRVMPSNVAQEEWLLFLYVGSILSFLASPRYGRPYILVSMISTSTWEDTNGARN
jgi:hypothetical protein